MKMKEKLKKLAVKKAFVVGSLAATLALTGAGIASASGGQGISGPFNHDSSKTQDQNQNWQTSQNDHGQQNQNQTQNQDQNQNWQNNQANHSRDNHDQQNDQKDHHNDRNGHKNDNRGHNDYRNNNNGWWNNHHDQYSRQYGNEISIYGTVESTDSNGITVRANDSRTYSVDTSHVDASNKNGDSMRASDVDTGDHVTVRGFRRGGEIYAQTLRDFNQS